MIARIHKNKRNINLGMLPLCVLMLCFSLMACTQNQQDSKDVIAEKAIGIVKQLQAGDVEGVKSNFYSNEYFDELQNVEEAIPFYKSVLADLQIGAKENIEIEDHRGKITSEFFPKDSVTIMTAEIPIAVEMPSPIPKYIVMLHFVEADKDYKLVALDMKSTKIEDAANELPVFDKIEIKKGNIANASFMYEGGHKEPLIFKRKTGLLSEMPTESKVLEVVLAAIEKGKIIKSQRETDTRRFNGDPELGIIHLNQKDGHVWTLFTLISEEEGKKENFPGVLELRYYQYLNLAVTYWIEVEDADLLKKAMEELCHSGENIRKEAKKPK